MILKEKILMKKTLMKKIRYRKYNNFFQSDFFKFNFSSLDRKVHQVALELTTLNLYKLKVFLQLMAVD